MHEKNKVEMFIKSGLWKTIPFKIIDTEPDIGKHTYLCSCEECIKIKKTLFGDFSKEGRSKYKNSLLERVLLNDKIW